MMKGRPYPTLRITPSYSFVETKRGVGKNYYTEKKVKLIAWWIRRPRGIIREMRVSRLWSSK